MKLLIVGATGGSGRAAVERALKLGHEITAFSRHASALNLNSPRLTTIDGDATDEQTMYAVMPGHDAVIVTLGISENPLRVRLFGPSATPMNVRSAGTRCVIEAMKAHQIRRIVVQASFGVGATRSKLRWIERAFFALLLKQQIADTELQDAAVVESGLDWVLVHPVHLTDGPDDAMPFYASDGATGAMKLSRRSVGNFLVHAATSAEFTGQTMALSGHPTAAMVRTQPGALSR